LRLCRGLAIIGFSNLLRFSGYDVASWEDVLLQPNKLAVLTTRLLLTLPEGSRLITAPRSGELLPDGVDIVPREIESYELCDVPISFWNRSPDFFQGTPNVFSNFAICSLLFFSFL